ncbi:MAG: T9SS type A sorting domain-containing protein [Ignavibacteriaceae bacterium]|nr:T9SS type A sorting domain-containing protein [Ignavibacteriaceae bacterium]
MKEKLILLLFLFTNLLLAQNAIIVVIDGARYSETFGGGNTYIPHLYNDLKPNGYLYTNFRIADAGITSTNPGHASILTGTWQTIANNGIERPTFPTIFEYLREEDGNPQSDCYAVTGKDKLDILTYSVFSGYGSSYGGVWVGDDDRNDALTYSKAISVMQNYQPKILIVNFAEVDVAGHSNDWDDYVADISNADNLVYQLWQTIETGTYGYTPQNTSVFITNDHGRHSGGNWNGHGDNCEGCEHIMLLVLGRNVTAGVENPDLHHQIDIAPTIGDLLGFNTPHAVGTSLYDDINPLPVELAYFSAVVLDGGVKLEWRTETEVSNYGFEILRSAQNDNWEKIGFVEGHGNSNSPKDYSFIDSEVNGGKYSYRLKQIDTDGSFEYSKIIEVDLGSPQEFELSQNYPNPFNPATKIRYTLPEAGNVKLVVYNLLGEQVAELINEFKEAGVHTINFNAENLNSGLYIYKIELTGFTAAKKMQLVK